MAKEPTYTAKPEPDELMEEIRRDLGLKPQPHKSAQIHPVDTRWSTKPVPDGFDQWYSDLRANHSRAFNRIIAELNSIKETSNFFALCDTCKTPEKCYQDKDAKFSFHARIPVFESCFQAYYWTTNISPTINNERERRRFVSESEDILRNFRSVRRSLKAAPAAMNRLTRLLLHDPLEKRGLELRRIDKSDNDRWPMERSLFELLDAMEEGLSLAVDFKGILMNYYSSASPLADVAITHPYMCLGFPSKTNFSTTKSLNVETALTLQLSEIFRSLTSENIKQIPRLKDLAGWGKPFYRQAATIALCAIGDQPPAKSAVDKLIEAAELMIKRNPNVSIYQHWEEQQY